MEKKENRLLELIRFGVCGIACALLDYFACQVVILHVTNLSSNWLTVVSTAAGFVVGVIANYFISTYWVYQNVDKNRNTKSPLFVFLFVLLSLIAMFLSIGAMLLCNLFCKNVIGIDITSASIVGLIKDLGFSFLVSGIFWSYFISFCIKTLVGLVFNYFTRKYILYKEPKK